MALMRRVAGVILFTIGCGCALFAAAQISSVMVHTEARHAKEKADCSQTPSCDAGRLLLRQDDEDQHRFSYIETALGAFGVAVAFLGMNLTREKKSGEPT